MISAPVSVIPSGIPQAMPLAITDHVRLDASVLHRLPLVRSAGTTLHLIDDQQDACRLAKSRPEPFLWLSVCRQSLQRLVSKGSRGNGTLAAPVFLPSLRYQNA
jgi:hypothetical protein